MMTGGGEVQHPTAGGPAGHIPVLRREALDALSLVPGGLYLDGTFGGGGYTRAILEAFSDTRVLAIDRDPTALAAGQALVARFPGRLTLCDGTFGAMDEIAAEAGLLAFDGIALDVGVSSMQFDEAARGFSFRFDAPLDMRMSGEGESAADILAGRSEEEIADILFHYGEERKARPIARAIVAARREGGIGTTMALAELVARIVWAKPGDIHPATRTFQALRIAVNDELVELAHGLHAAERLLKPGGRLAVVSFHSLEDRIVKVFFAARSGKGGGSRHHPVAITGAPTFSIEGKWPRVASEAEVAANPRARSAKLRAATRTPAPARAPEAGVMALATLPEPARRRR